jgi:hypothetical protein
MEADTRLHQGGEKRMTATELREALARRPDLLAKSACSPKVLLLDEVRRAGLPAYFFDDGEKLVFLDGELYDLAETRAGTGAPRPLPREVLESGVGIEYGWHHIEHCACPLCRSADHATDAVA